ncbi:hypothetical protein SAMN05446037_101561 [Anaerovirgula multivorans]|uniref:Uncharacterized protein n=1 Tax=Anaerovirgula multivorans TaxID=312168 RepID=A0A239G4P9_9FIRM|nr:hypothetical protein [Anaerovirgula multivorans]SNS64081.1 hypothetical protein SAMN05446037_101561 [Anaerovirgula multivorans]
MEEKVMIREMFNDIITRLDVIQKEQQEMKSDLTETKNDLAEVKTDLAEVKIDLAEVKIDLTEVKTDLTEVKTDLLGVKNDVSKLQQSQETIRSYIFNVDKTLKNCEEDHRFIEALKKIANG